MRGGCDRAAYRPRRPASQVHQLRIQADLCWCLCQPNDLCKAPEEDRPGRLRRPDSLFLFGADGQGRRLRWSVGEVFQRWLRHFPNRRIRHRIPKRSEGHVGDRLLAGENSIVLNRSPSGWTFGTGDDAAPSTNRLFAGRYVLTSAGAELRTVQYMTDLRQWRMSCDEQLVRLESAVEVYWRESLAGPLWVAPRESGAICRDLLPERLALPSIRAALAWTDAPFEGVSATTTYLGRAATEFRTDSGRWVNDAESGITLSIDLCGEANSIVLETLSFAASALPSAGWASVDEPYSPWPGPFAV